jgi:hypothetical protein
VAERIASARWEILANEQEHADDMAELLSRVRK